MTKLRRTLGVLAAVAAPVAFLVVETAAKNFP
jgi:hypothetical protein